MTTFFIRIPCSECRRLQTRHEVDCAVEQRVLDEMGVDDADDIELGELYRRHDNDDGVEIDGVCSDCGSDYERDRHGNIVD